MSELSAYHSRLPYGERVSAEPVLGSPFFPFDGDIQVVPLAEPVVPEPPRIGEPGREPCDLCTDPVGTLVWRDGQWRLHAGLAPTGLPMVAMLTSVRHVTLHTMPVELVATLGPMIQRVVRAFDRIPGVGRVHFSRFGDGSAHFHMWFRARPLGMMQLRGPMLAVWDGLLPPIPADELEANIATLATALGKL
jgi:hypothetical protein